VTDRSRRVGPWTVKREETVFDNPWIRVVDHDVTHPDGTGGQYGVVAFKNRAIGVLPIHPDGTTVLVGQHRFPLDAYSWELPEGGGPLGEDSLAGARRELREETGLSAAQWLEFSSFDISNSVTNETATCFLAWQLTEGAASPEPSEALAIKIVAFSELHDRVLAGDIRDSLTIVMVLAARAKALRGMLPRSISELILKS